MSLTIFILLIIHLLPISSTFSAPQTISSFSIKNSPWKPTDNITLVSPNSTFTAGFHPVTPTSKLYVFSVWYANISDHTLVWSTKWDLPVSQTGFLTITSKGELHLTNGSSTGPNPWPSSSPVGTNSTRLTLRDDGNLMFGSWNSFQHPTDTILPTQNINGTILMSKNQKFQFNGSKSLVFNGSDAYWSSGSGFLSLGLDGQIQLDGASPLLSSDFGQNRTRRLFLSNDGNLQKVRGAPRQWENVAERQGRR